MHTYPKYVAVVVPFARNLLTSSGYLYLAAHRSLKLLSTGKVYLRSHSMRGTSVPVPVNLYCRMAGKVE
jgi:hypothetical protein